jgi:mono/diheme cytochrome c family protein
MLKRIKLFIPFLVFVGLIAFALSNVAVGAAPDGKAIFLENKCNMCHTIDAVQIAKISGKPTPNGPPDLSTVGSRHNAEWITKYVKKEIDQNSKKHMKAYTGKPEDLQTLATWLESLKEKK